MSGWSFVMNLKDPPGRKSISHAASGSPAGSHQQATCSGFVQASKISARGASKLRVSFIVCDRRSMTSPVFRVAVCADGISFLLLLFHRGKVRVEIVQTALPLLAEGLDPVGNVLHRKRGKSARTSLCIAPTLDEARMLEHLEVLRDGRLTEFKRLHQLRNGGFTLRQPGEDRSPGWIAEGLEGCIERICVILGCHETYVDIWQYNSQERDQKSRTRDVLENFQRLARVVEVGDRQVCIGFGSARRCGGRAAARFILERERRHAKIGESVAALSSMLASSAAHGFHQQFSEGLQVRLVVLVGEKTIKFAEVINRDYDFVRGALEQVR